MLTRPNAFRHGALHRNYWLTNQAVAARHKRLASVKSDESVGILFELVSHPHAASAE